MATLRWLWSALIQPQPAELAALPDLQARGDRAALLCVAAINVASFCKNFSASGPASTNTKPGFVQNCPTPSVTEPCRPPASVSAFAFSAPGSRKTGLRLLIAA